MTRPCERKCKTCGQWLHHSRFHSWTREKRGSNGTFAPIRFDTVCLDCRQKERNEKKNLDRPLAIIKQRALAAAHKAGAPIDFMWIDMNYASLVEAYRVLKDASLGTARKPNVPGIPGYDPDKPLTAICQTCGHLFEGQGDIQIEHIEPPRHRKDWARLHARNLRLMCTSCNGKKSKKSFAQWLDDEEKCRIANLADKSVEAVDSDQLSLFGEVKAS